MKPNFSLLAVLTCVAVPAFAVPVSIKVVGPNDQPLTEATLSSFQTQFIYDEVPVVTARTGVGGVFSWNYDGEFYDKWPVGEKPFLRVRVAAPGMAPQFQVIRQGQTTIRLQPMRSWGGVVLDQNQQPLVGAKITLGMVSPATEEPGEKDELLGAFIPVEKNATVTDKEGRWSFEGVPLRGKAKIDFAAPGFVSQSFSLAIGEGDAAPVYAALGGSISGVLLAPDGQPLAGETVSAGFGSPIQVTTDDAGRFTLSGIEAGEAWIYAGAMFFSFSQRDKKELPSYLFANPTRAQVEVGKTADVGEIKAQKGLLIKARVVAADTKAPLPNARFRTGYSDVASVTGADGQLQSRILPPTRRVGFDKPKIENAGYVDYAISPALLESKEETLDLGVIALERGNVIQGKVRVEGAKGEVRAPGLSFSSNGNYDFVRVKEDGTFASKTLGAGSYNVNINSAGQDWKIVSPRTVTLPAWGETVAPIEVVVERLTPVLPLIKQARGRVLDADGQGVAGVTVRARLLFDGGGAYSNGVAISDNEGVFTLDGGERTVGVEVESTEHPNYLISGKTQVQIADGIATVTGLVAKKRGAVFAGRVTDAQGKAAAGAWVGIVEARDYEPVQADNNGKFELTDVPLDKFILLAASGSDWAKQAVQSDQTGVSVALKNSSGVADKARALEQLMSIKSGVMSDTVFGAWDVLGTENIERYLRRNGEPAPEILALFGAELARRDGAQLLRRAPELLGAAQGEAREDLEAQINLLRAASQDAGERTDANAWLDEQKQVKREISARSVTRLLQMAAVAGKLKREDAAQWLDYAAAIAEQGGGNTRGQTSGWAPWLAALGFDTSTRMVEEQKPTDEFKVWADVAPALAKAGDIKGARAAIDRLEVLARDPEIIKAENSNNWEISPRRMDSARQSLARALAPTDAPAALELAGQIKDEFLRARALMQVADGARAMPNGQGSAVAEKALRDVMKAYIGNVEYFAQAAAIGAQISPQLGEELFALAKAKALPKRETISFSAPSIGAWAFYHAPLDPALSRLLIEREWDWRLPAAREGKDDNYADFSAIYQLVKGMAAIDAGRATEMQALADTIESNRYGREISQFDIAVVALADAEQRVNLGMDSQF